MLNADVFQALTVSLLAFVAQVGLIWLLGVWTLILYRQGGLHRLQRVTVGLRGAPAWVADVVFAGAITFCGCMTHPPVRQFFKAGEEGRALSGSCVQVCNLLRQSIFILV